MNDLTYALIKIGVQVFSTIFILTFVDGFLNGEDDDDDSDGGILQPVYVRSR